MKDLRTKSKRSAICAGVKVARLVASSFRNAASTTTSIGTFVNCNSTSLRLFAVAYNSRAYGQFSDLTQHLDHTSCDLRTLSILKNKTEQYTRFPASVARSILERREDLCRKGLNNTIETYNLLEPNPPPFQNTAMRRATTGMRLSLLTDTHIGTPVGLKRLFT